MCNERGGTIDDLYVYCLSKGVYFLIVNASRVQADVAWLQKQEAAFPRRDELFMTDASHNYAAVAVQGPEGESDFINTCFPNCLQLRHACFACHGFAENQIGGFL